MEADDRYMEKDGGITMKRIAFALLLAALLCVSAAAVGELGFAEVKKENVNLRNAPGGKTVMQVDAPQSVFVFDERQADGQLWCHVTTIRGKGTAEGWIRGDMLRFVSDEFTDIVFVQAGDHYVTGVRADGTVAILGDDMPHSPCIDTVRSWRDVAKVTSSTCAVYALKPDKSLMTVGRSSEYGVWQAADISGEQPVLLDEDGYILEDTWWNAAHLDYYLPQEARSMRFTEAAPIERSVQGGLTRDGKVVWFGENKALESAFANGPYTDIDMYFYHLAALREDGRVDAAIRLNVYKPEASESACDVAGWENVVQVAAGLRHTLGLKADGTVYYAGDDARHRAQVEAWTDVAQIDAGNGYSIALRADGSVMMAGEYRGYIR